MLTTAPIVTYFGSWLKDRVISILKTGPMPKHIALIMDGNRRYAENRHLAFKDGHYAGANSLVEVLDACYKLGISQVTIYAFSIENFNRPKQEVDTLFGMLREKLQYLSENEDSFSQQKDIAIRILGNRSLIPPDILTDLEYVEHKTLGPNPKGYLNICFPYTSRDDITAAIKKTLGTNEHDISIQTLVNNMYLGPDAPQLDILIRTSGHHRLSDFMLWQCNKDCTIEFVDTLWPDFKFLAITRILLKWSYYKTIAPDVPTNNVKPKNPKKTNILSSLAPPPTLATVGKR